MAMDLANGEHSILDWDEDDVHRWLSSLGFPQYEAQIKGAARVISEGSNVELHSIYQSTIYPVTSFAC
jgi:hypothetical protein